MNIRFEINKFENENVIATSGNELCIIHKDHYKVVELTAGDSIAECHWYTWDSNTGSFKDYGTTQMPVSAFEGGTATVDSYYVGNQNDKYEKCTEDHNY